MKKILSITTVFLFAILFSGCGNNSANLKSSMGSKTELTAEEMEDKMLEISTKLEEGEITGAEASKLMKELKANAETKSQKLSKSVSNISEFKVIPSWAKALNAPDVKGLTLVPGKSTIVAAGNGYTQYFEAVYTGDKEAVLSEAKRIGNILKLEIETEAEGMLSMEGALDDGYTATVQAIYQETGDAELFYNIHAEVVNSVKKPN